ncbi:hypothetical protein [Muricoccus vinaceus]|uniref:Uncharacterized protein n=1 Tax=Muricoccus vinaceus TaxID=424704 RepID=A0ABV6ITH7_9PROT
MRVPLPGRDYFPPRVLLRGGRSALEAFRAREAQAHDMTLPAGQVSPLPVPAMPSATTLADLRPVIA